MSKTSSSKPRDPLLDLWRGLALVDMAWVHLATYPIGMAAVLAAWIGDYTRFAAGAFVFISGLSVARVFGPKLAGDPAVACATRGRLFRRALMLAALDRLVAVVFTLLERTLSVPPSLTPRYPDVLDLLTFAEPGVTGGLLSLYAILLAATPLLDGARRRFGSAAILAASVALFALAHLGAFGTPGAVWPFPFVYWQPLFVAGYLASHQLAALRDGSGGISWRWLAAISGAFAVLFLLRNGISIGLLEPSAIPAWAFLKVPLSPAELAWYLAVSGFVLTWSAWVWERTAWTRWLLGWLPLLGRQSLLVYVAHLFVQLALVEALTLLDPPPLVRPLVLPLMALILVGVAFAGTGLQYGMTRRPAPAIVGSAVMASTFGIVLAMQLVIGTPAGWNLDASAENRLGPSLGTDAGADIASLGEMDPDSDQAPWSTESGGDRYQWFMIPSEDNELTEFVSDS